MLIEIDPPKVDHLALYPCSHLTDLSVSHGERVEANRLASSTRSDYRARSPRIC
jgi:hypothetical protein